MSSLACASAVTVSNFARQMLTIIFSCFEQVWAAGCPGLQNLSHTVLRVALSIFAIALTDVGWMSGAVGESGDLPCALVPAHCSGAMVEGFDEDDCLVGGHAKPLVSVLLLSALHPCSKMADPLFVK